MKQSTINKIQAMKLSNNSILILILIAATALRFYNYFEIPFTHDEFSALFRTYFDNFSELIDKGVKVDGHPAGIQVFLYYWIKIFGASEWIVKLPFTVFGILSVLLIYLIAKNRYNETVGLISAAFSASVQFSVMYSQIARPYISGLFFSLLMVYFWTKVIFNPNKKFYRNSIFFIISASLCTYNHHFSLLFAVIVGVSGLFFINKKYLIQYIISGLLIFVLYIPHINIFIYQLNVGGIGGWLGKPHNNFIINYLKFIFNFSLFSIGLAIILFVFGFYKKTYKNIQYKKHILFFAWFILPFLFGFFYSKYVNAVLQFSVLIFSFPFLFFVLFGHIKKQKTMTNLILVLVILFINTFSLIYTRKHYELFYNSPYKEILKDYRQANKKDDNVISIIHSHKKITDYYLSNSDIDSSFIWFDSFENEIDFINFLENKSKSNNKLYLGCLSSINPNTVQIIQDYFPTIEEQKNYFTGTSYMFSKKPQKENNIIQLLNFESENYDLWNSVDKTKYIDSVSFSGNNSYIIDSDTEWGPSYSEKLENIITNENNFIDISVKVKIPNKYEEITLVASLDSDGENVYWSGISFDKFLSNKKTENNWTTVYHSLKLSDIYKKYNNLILKIYIWNKGKNIFYIDDFKIRLRKGNPVIYGLIEDIE